MTAPLRSPAVAAWERRGVVRHLAGHDVFTVEIDAARTTGRPPLLVLHGFPTSSFDFHAVIDGLARDRRVFLCDFVGFGLSDKPDLAYSIGLHADVAAAFTEAVGVTELSLLTHDLGDTVGGELLARQRVGRWEVTVVHRVLTNGSIYIDMARLTAGQELLLALPDRRLPPDAAIGPEELAAGIAVTFAPGTGVDSRSLAALCELVVNDDGASLLPRLVRYIEERRRNERRFTGAIEDHPSPLSVVWGAADPVAVEAMVGRLSSARPDARVALLPGLGHYPMLEDPARFVAAVVAALD